MLADEIRELLRELARTTRAATVAVVHQRPAPPTEEARAVPLGQGAFLRIELVSRAASEHVLESGGRVGAGTRADPRSDDLAVAEAMERYARALRACARRWGEDRVPESAMKDAPETRQPPGERIRERIHAFVAALAQSQNADVVLVTLGRRVVASSVQAEPLHLERIPFIARRVAVEAERQGNSHAQLAGDDFFAVSFWFDACLVAFFSAPYSEDFMRYRARMVTRELAPLLAMLDDPPPAPAGVAPIPD